MNNKELIIFTDGSFMKSTNYCGYGVYFPNNEYKSYGKQILENKTNQRAELKAIYSALKKINKYLKEYKNIIIYSDSMYSINCVTNWYKSWQKNNWVNSQNKAVLNQDIIKPLVDLLNTLKLKNYNINFKHVRSHTGENTFEARCNDEVDKLAKGYNLDKNNSKEKKDIKINKYSKKKKDNNILSYITKSKSIDFDNENLFDVLM